MLRIWIGEEMSQETPLYAAETVEVGTLPQRALDAVGDCWSDGCARHQAGVFGRLPIR
jgi:hypothetical protein